MKGLPIALIGSLIGALLARLIVGDLPIENKIGIVAFGTICGLVGFYTARRKT